MLKKLALIALFLVMPFAGLAQDKEEKFEDYIKRVGTSGPAHIAVREQATLDLPEGYAFIPQKPATELLEKMGDDVEPELVGMVFPIKNPEDWFITIDYSPSGYIKDDDAKTWDADKMLGNITDGVTGMNERRVKQGLPEVEIIGWVEKPHYEEATRRLIWSVEGRNKGSTNAADNIINYQMLQLGREGYVSMIMATNRALIDQLKPTAAMMLSKLTYKEGKRYSDFNISTDKVAEYGLGALIVGVAAKKLGLIALGIAFAAKFAKVIILAVVGFFAVLRNKFRRKTVPKLPPPGSPGA